MKKHIHLLLISLASLMLTTSCMEDSDNYNLGRYPYNSNAPSVANEYQYDTPNSRSINMNGDHFLIADNESMEGAVSTTGWAPKENGITRVIDHLRPGTTYYVSNVYKDELGGESISPYTSFKTYDNYSVTAGASGKDNVVITTSKLVFDYLLVAENENMTNAVKLPYSESGNYRVSGLQPNHKYYYTTQATDIFDKEYFTEVKTFTTQGFSIICEVEEVTVCTARIRARLDGTYNGGKRLGVWFYPMQNGSVIRSGGSEPAYANNDNTWTFYWAIAHPGETYQIKAQLFEYESSANGAISESEPVTFTTASTHQAAEAIDLGLSVKWASWNVGATKPEGYGGLFSYGDTGYNYNVSSYGSFNNISGTSSDMARKAWGGSWRMPTYTETQELYDNCDPYYDTVNGIKGLTFKSRKNGATIFFPFAGKRLNTWFGARYEAVEKSFYMWTGSMHHQRTDANSRTITYCYDLYCDTQEGGTGTYGIGNPDASSCFSIRPVCP